MKRYIAVSCDLPGVSDERLASELEGFPILGSSIEDGAAGPIATIYLAPEHDREVDRLCRTLADLGADGISVETVEEYDWITAYRRGATPFAVGDRWWIDPHPEGSGSPPEGRIRLAVEPSSAFGSGSHESTQLVLLALQHRDLAGCSVLDLGTGSGILAAASLALGAQMVVGVDVDAEAVWTARRVCRRQGRADRPLLIVATVSALGESRFDLVLCNMMSSELVPLAPDLARVLAPRGRLILSGVLCAERDVVLQEFERVGLRAVREQRLGEWVGWTLGRD